MSFADASGRTVALWPFRPDGAVLERLEWLTDVLLAFDGSEQRIALREYPRRVFEYACGFSDRDRREAENLLYGWQALPFAIPVWTDSEPLAATLSAGAASIPADTSTRDYVAGGQALLIASAQDWEVVSIAAVNASSLDLNGVTVSTRPANSTLLMPLQTAELDDAQSLARFTGADSSARLRWNCLDSRASAAASESTYRSMPVQLLRPNWARDLEQEFVRKLEDLDFATGTRFRDDEAGGPVLMQSHLWTLTTRAEIAAFRAWCYARQGRLSHYWQPSWAQDLRVLSNIADTDTTVDVEFSGYTARVAQDVGRRDVRIQTTAGDIYYRRITGSAVIDADTERLTLDSALGASVAVSEVALVSFMHLLRLNTDAVELNWFARDSAESLLVSRGVRNDL